MSSAMLQRLRCEDFAVAVGFHSNPAALRRRLARMPEIAAVQEALGQNAVTEEGIRRFVSQLMEDFTRGEHFAHEDALAALCVALETRPTDFADEFLHDLARLKLAELSLAIRVARECLRRQASLTRHTIKVFNVARMPQPTASVAETSSWVAGENGSAFAKTISVVCEVG